MKKKILILAMMFVTAICLFGGEIIDGKKIFSNEEIMESFKGGSAVWNKFRAENPDLTFESKFENKEFKKINLEKYNLKGMSFKGSNMAGAVLKNADLEGANLEDVNFYNADLKETNLKGANLLKANLDNTTLYNSDMENAKVNLKWKEKIEKKSVKKIRLIDWKR